jgi:hypothetical protein
MKRALVIGAGWYGCYTACILERLGVAFDIVDKNDSFFGGSSSKNQNRLHLGFHYPRSHRTRRECIEGYECFMREFAAFAVPIRSLYMVSNASLLDVQTFKAVMQSEGLPFQEVALNDINRQQPVQVACGMVDGACAFEVGERFIDFEGIANYYRERLGRHMVVYGTEREYDYDCIFDCTYGQLAPLEGQYLELCLTLLYKARSQGEIPVALTMMDGDFFSIYPYNIQEGVYTLTHPKYTHVAMFKTREEVEKAKGAFGEADVARFRKLIEGDVVEYVPNFAECYDYCGFYLSIKAKFETASGCADRSLRIQERENVMAFVGGKITGVFHLADAVEKFICKHM